MKNIERKEYLDFLIRLKDKQIIKVISGVRRCGKSTLFELYRNYLLENGVLPKQIISINFEDLDFEEYTDYKKLYSYIKESLIEDKKNYIFLDEIQHVEHFEKAVDSLFIKSNTDIYITGSNAYFMSGELATVLTGRYVELKMLPLSFKEFCEGLENFNLPPMTILQKYNKYLVESSFPYTLELEGNKKNIREYLEGIYNSIILKDVITRMKVGNPLLLESVVKFLFGNIGSFLSSNKIANTLTSLGRKIDYKTIEKYIKGLTDSLILYEVKRYDIRGKQLLANLSKYYVVDIGLRQLLLTNKSSDMGHILENIVYLELIRRGYEVYVGQLKDKEVDFVAINHEEINYYQVSLTVLDENTLARELRPLQEIADNHAKYLITLDEILPNSNYDGIKRVNAIEWLLKE
ncbi:MULTISPECIES: ATP-binding protein [Fusobacterium]|uniref:ATP-binding protein n=1 Tax=Fusobacterium TaxID=848 RepID=UPI0014772933|nr:MULTISPECIES: ATP-binding protein [Fusobacterium]NME35839.1 ATP-binding protein [Fusobacterium sp. FSA-380-WT-3A]